MFCLLTLYILFTLISLSWGLFSSGSKYFSYWQSKTLTGTSTKYDTNISPLVCHLKKKLCKKEFCHQEVFHFYVFKFIKTSFVISGFPLMFRKAFPRRWIVIIWVILLKQTPMLAFSALDLDLLIQHYTALGYISFST